MEIKVEDIGPCKKLVRISVPYSEMELDVSRIKRSIQQKANVPGFRRGKAPMGIVEQYYGDVIKNQIIQEVVNNSYKKALEEKQLRPIRQVVVENIDYKEGEKLDFNFKIEVVPQFDLPQYTGILIKKKIQQVTDEHIEAELRYLQERNAYFEPVEGRGAEMGDFVVVDYTIKEKQDILDEAKQVWIEMRDDFFIPKFCEGLIGLKKGDEKEIKVVLPKEYAKPELGGKKVIIRVRINEIKKKVLPELTDEFAKGLGNFNNLNELREKIRNDLTLYFQQVTERDMISQIEDYLLKNTKIDVPESVVDSFHDVLYEDAISYLKSTGRATEEFIKEKEADLKESTRRDAISQVKLVYILEGIANKEGIDVTADEIDKRIEEIAKRNNKKPEEIRQYLDREDKWWDFRYRLRNEKLTRFLLDKANIVERIELPGEERNVGSRR